MEAFPYRHLLGIEGLPPQVIVGLLDLAEAYARHGPPAEAPLRGLTLVNAFFEVSTRTLVSFEIAGKRLGADVVNLVAGQSSLRKGETLLDTALTLDAMRPDVIVIRHEASGAVELIAGKVGCPVVNAGDGRHEHPTQALLDALTIRRRKGRIQGLKVAICGDLLHSRVARSNFLLLTALGAEVRAVAPPTLMPAGIEDYGVIPFTAMDEGIAGADVVMVLRLQRERMEGSFVPSTREYYATFGLTPERLQRAAPDVLVMHPGPMNRGVEIASAVADDIQRSAIAEQVAMGVAVRMACLDLLTRSRRG
ncbi:MAG: aspartate carbamoyltransferase catalytic subunit [Sphingomonadaceae bacterium]|uniref:aspartate carbamoyltransferase catalytic subunit n=1 Tax=Thermaurantiacus sp. TaxID=2820283 RepID=UPI00298F3658|nr:aspartate carbamoyltransferase catalytic subunit [Thermaurantiacus sp.]MCS6987612.1 aspartate carbamoyltransferase catalytic subunit [Sphingomonadaceae bacterium]MDW8415213.1 aspartate carbamoyltransferase catalytic subunit [Thermaurantiacus sp.]